MAPSETQQLRACGALWRHRAEHGAISLLKKRCADNHLQRHPGKMALLFYLALHALMHPAEMNTDAPPPKFWAIPPACPNPAFATTRVAAS